MGPAACTFTVASSPAQWLLDACTFSLTKEQTVLHTNRNAKYLLTKKFKYILHSKGHWLPLSLRIAFSNRALIRCVKPVSGIVVWTSLPSTLQDTGPCNSETSPRPRQRGRKGYVRDNGCESVSEAALALGSLGTGGAECRCDVAPPRPGRQCPGFWGFHTTLSLPTSHTPTPCFSRTYREVK